MKKTTKHLIFDAPLNSLKGPKVGLRMKRRKNKKVRACSLIHSTFGVGGCVRVLGWDYGEFTNNSSK